MNKAITNLDEQHQTAQDYSVVVHDPDPDASDPKEWRDYFSQFGEVASVTVALKNGELLRALARRRFIKLMLQYEGEEGEEFNLNDQTFDLARKKSFSKSKSMSGSMNMLFKSEKGAKKPNWMKHELNKVNAQEVLSAAGFGKTQDQWMEQWEDNQQKLLELYKQSYPVAKVMCIFEEEESQRKCLDALVIGLIPSLFDSQFFAPKNTSHLFRGTNSLFVREALEPKDVIYENLGMHTPLQHG
jgi:hypothetical protein